MSRPKSIFERRRAISIPFNDCSIKLFFSHSIAAKSFFSRQRTSGIYPFIIEKIHTNFSNFVTRIEQKFSNAIPFLRGLPFS